MERFLGPLRNAWDNLNERERRLVAAMGAVAGAMVILLAMYLTSSAVAEAEDKRDAIRTVLADIDRASALLDEREAQRKKQENKYRRPAPPLAAFIEKQAKAEGLDVKQVVEQPVKEIGKYTRRHVRVRLTGVSLRPVMRLIASITPSDMPIAIERLKVEHYTKGDKYNVQLGVVAFDRKAKGAGGNLKNKAKSKKKKGKKG